MECIFVLKAWRTFMDSNGGAVLAMGGKNCVAIAADRRYSLQSQSVSADVKKIFKMGPHLYVGLPGLATDTQTVFGRLRFRVNLYELKENRKVKPKVLQAILTNILYERRFGSYFVNPVIAGLEPDTFKPFLCAMDIIGSPMVTKNFALSGSCSEQMYGMCEAFWQPEMEADKLFDKTAQALLNSIDRCAITGWGGIVHLIEKDKVTTRTIKGRSD